MTFLTKKSKSSLPITPVSAADFNGWLKAQDAPTKGWVKAAGFSGAQGSLLILKDATGAPARVLFGTGKDSGLYTYAELPAKLPKHAEGYFIDAPLDTERANQAALGWTLGCYHYDRYKSGAKKQFASLVWPSAADQAFVKTTADAVYMVRDLVNTPANHLGPAEIADASKKIASRFNTASVKIIVGKALLKENYPAIYEVGKGSPRDPRLIDIRWGKKGDPKITLVGKGVAFDTGGLDIKPSAGMLLMKKDMGGAAHVLGLAHMIMSEKLPVQLRVLIPAVENSTDGHSFRPGDVIQSRKGLSIEIGNTDAEGRLILCDALAEACREKPDLIIDFATLTGAARVALGPDLPAMFSNDDGIAADLLASGIKTDDPMWRLPLWQPYTSALDSKIADTNNVGGQAGAVTAALFLEKFVDEGIKWVHIDTFAWTPSARPGRPEGGEALGMRASYDMIKNRFGAPRVKAKPAKNKTAKQKPQKRNPK